MSFRHCWKKYQIKTTTTYTWNRYSVKSSSQLKVIESESYSGVDCSDMETAIVSTGYSASGNKAKPSGGTQAFDYDDSYYLAGEYYSRKSPATYIYLFPDGNALTDTFYRRTPPTGSEVVSISTMYWVYDDSRSREVRLRQYNNNYDWGIDTLQVVSNVGPGTAQGQVTSTNRSAYPDNGQSGSYWYTYQSSNTTQSAGTYVEDVIGAAKSQYPANGVSGSYWYVYQGSDSIDPVAVNLSQSSGLYVGLPITISVDPSTSKVYGGTVSYQYQAQLNNDGHWVTLETTTETSYPYTIPIGATNLQFRVLASDDLGFTSTDYVNSASVSVVAFKPGTQQVLHRKNASGSYDVIWLETDSEVVIRPDGTTLEATLADIESRLSGLGV